MKKPHFQLLIALVLGMLLGVVLHPFREHAVVAGISSSILGPVGQIFLRLLLMTVVPIIFSALVIGVYDLRESHGFGKVAAKTFAFTLILSAASVVIGISLTNAFKPGIGVPVDAGIIAGQKVALEKIASNAANAKSTSATIIELVPRNPVDAAAKALDGEMIALMLFALILGLALSAIDRGKAEDNILIHVLKQLFGASMKIVEWAMMLAPFAVFSLVFVTSLRFGHSIFLSLMWYVLIVVMGLLMQQFLVYAPLLKAVTRKSPFAFFGQCREVYLYAFATASSNATLPRSIEAAEKKLGLPPQISRFVLTVGATANQNGTALFEGVTVLFLAQVYSIDLSLTQQVQVVIMSILAGVGTAGIPGGSLPMIMVLLQQVGIPVEGLGMVLGVDRFLDMARTTLNVSGDLVVTALVSGPGGKKGR